MSENLHFDFEKAQMCVDVPHDIMQKSLAKSRAFSRIINLTDPKYNVIEYAVGDDSTRLLFNARKASRKLKAIKEQKYEQILGAIEIVTTFTPDDRQDPNLQMSIGLEKMGSSDRYGFYAKVKWPDKNPSQVSDDTTQAMQRMAKDVRYIKSNKMLDSMVYAQLVRDSGVTLETNPIASSSLDTDGSYYDPTESEIELSAHNLYSHQMQMICLSGLIAIARS